MKIFISQPMADKTEKQIKKEREKIIKDYDLNKFDIIDSIIEENPPKECDFGLWYLAKSIEMLSTANTIIFMPNWENARGCTIEHECAVKYNKNIKYINK